MKLFKKRRQPLAPAVHEEAHPEVVWGGNWHAIEPTASSPLRNTAEREARKRGATKFVIVANDHDQFVGLPPKGKGNARRGHAFLSGQLLASVHGAADIRFLGEPGAQINQWSKTERVAYLGALDDRTFVFVATIAGIPYMDLVGDAATVRKGVDDFKEHLFRSGLLLIQDEAAVAREFGELPREFTMAEAVPGLPYNARTKEALRPLEAVSAAPVFRLVVGAGAVFGVLFLGVWGYDAYIKKSLSVEQISRKEQEARALRQKYAAAQLEAVNKEGTVVATEAAQPVWSFIAKANTDRVGFTLVRVHCAAAACEYFYRRNSNLPTFTDFVKAHGEREHPKFDIAMLDDATTTTQIPDFDKLPTLDVSTVKHDPELLLKLGTTAQKLLLAGVKLTFTAPADLVPQGDEYRLMRRTDIEMMRRLSGSWTLEGPTDTLVPALRRLPPSAVLSSVEVKVGKTDGEDVVIAKGRYFLAPAGGSL